jgi:hypothetical protein
VRCQKDSSASLRSKQLFEKLPRETGVHRATLDSTMSAHHNIRLARRYLHRAAAEGTRITTLNNKIRVATETSPGYFASVGIYFDAGSRYETPETSGASHFLERLAYKV